MKTRSVRPETSKSHFQKRCPDVRVVCTPFESVYLEDAWTEEAAIRHATCVVGSQCLRKTSSKRIRLFFVCAILDFFSRESIERLRLVICRILNSAELHEKLLLQCRCNSPTLNIYF